MLQIMVIFIAGSFLAMLTKIATAQSYDVQDWQGPGTIGVALLLHHNLIPEVEAHYDDNFQLPIVDKTSHCYIRVSIPRSRLVSARSANNQMTCYLQDQRSYYAIVTLKLTDVHIKAWGSQFSYDHWEKEGLPKNFQFDDQDVSRGLYEALNRLDEAEYGLEKYRSCNTEKTICGYEVLVRGETKKNTLSWFLSCIKQEYETQEASYHCVFNYPNRLS